MQVIRAIREAILNAKDAKTLKRMSSIAKIMSEQLSEVPSSTKRRWKLAEKRASRRLHKEEESTAAKAKKGQQKSNTRQRKGKL